MSPKVFVSLLPELGWALDSGKVPTTKGRQPSTIGDRRAGLHLDQPGQVSPSPRSLQPPPGPPVATGFAGPLTSSWSLCHSRCLDKVTEAAALQGHCPCRQHCVVSKDVFFGCSNWASGWPCLQSQVPCQHYCSLSFWSAGVPGSSDPKSQKSSSWSSLRAWGAPQHRLGFSPSLIPTPDSRIANCFPLATISQQQLGRLESPSLECTGQRMMSLRMRTEAQRPRSRVPRAQVQETGVSNLRGCYGGQCWIPFRPWWALAWSFAGSYEQNVRENFISWIRKVDM